MTVGGAADPGLQPERTALAWQRTALAFFVLGLAVPGFAWQVLEAWAILPSAVVLSAAAVLFLAARHRYRRPGTGPGTGPGRLDGRLPLLATLTALLIAAVAMVAVLGVPELH